MSLASRADYGECQRLHREFGTTYYHASRLFPGRTRKRVHAVYGFVRVPDEWVDNPGHMSLAEQLRKLDDWRAQLTLGVEGLRPCSGVMRAFVETVLETGMDVGEPLVFLDAMEADLTVSRYSTYEELQGYMRGSASAVGVMMLYVMETQASGLKLETAKILGEAMQMTNFLRDVAEDSRRGRIYLPLDRMEAEGVTEEQVLAGRFDDNFGRFMEKEIAFTRGLYASSDVGIRALSPRSQRAVLLARVLYAGILDEIEKVGGNVFLGRVRTCRERKMRELGRVMVNPGKVLDELQSERWTSEDKASERAEV